MSNKWIKYNAINTIRLLEYNLSSHTSLACILEITTVLHFGIFLSSSFLNGSAKGARQKSKYIVKYFLTEYIKEAPPIGLKV